MPAHSKKQMVYIDRMCFIIIVCKTEFTLYKRLFQSSFTVLNRKVTESMMHNSKMRQIGWFSLVQ